MSLKTISAADIDLPYEDWGLSATFVPITGSSAACTIVQDVSKSGLDIYVMAGARTAMIRVRKSEVAAVKVQQDKFTVSGGTWRVSEVIDGELDPLEWVLELKKEL